MPPRQITTASRKMDVKISLEQPPVIQKPCSGWGGKRSIPTTSWPTFRRRLQKTSAHEHTAIMHAPPPSPERGRPSLGERHFRWQNSQDWTYHAMRTEESVCLYKKILNRGRERDLKTLQKWSKGEGINTGGTQTFFASQAELERGIYVFANRFKLNESECM